MPRIHPDYGAIIIRGAREKFGARVDQFSELTKPLPELGGVGASALLILGSGMRGRRREHQRKDRRRESLRRSPRNHAFFVHGFSKQ